MTYQFSVGSVVRFLDGIRETVTTPLQGIGGVVTCMPQGSTILDGATVDGDLSGFVAQENMYRIVFRSMKTRDPIIWVRESELESA